MSLILAEAMQFALLATITPEGKGQCARALQDILGTLWLAVNVANVSLTTNVQTTRRVLVILVKILVLGKNVGHPLFAQPDATLQCVPVRMGLAGTLFTIAIQLKVELRTIVVELIDIVITENHDHRDPSIVIDVTSNVFV